MHVQCVFIVWLHKSPSQAIYVCLYTHNKSQMALLSVNFFIAGNFLPLPLLLFQMPGAVFRQNRKIKSITLKLLRCLVLTQWDEVSKYLIGTSRTYIEFFFFFSIVQFGNSFFFLILSFGWWCCYCWMCVEHRTHPMHIWVAWTISMFAAKTSTFVFAIKCSNMLCFIRESGTSISIVKMFFFGLKCTNAFFCTDNFTYGLCLTFFMIESIYLSQIINYYAHLLCIVWYISRFLVYLV